MPVTVRVFLSWNVDRPSGAKVIESSEVQRDGSVWGRSVMIVPTATTGHWKEIPRPLKM